MIFGVILGKGKTTTLSTRATTRSTGDDVMAAGNSSPISFLDLLF